VFPDYQCRNPMKNNMKTKWKMLITLASAAVRLVSTAMALTNGYEAEYERRTLLC